MDDLVDSLGKLPAIPSAPLVPHSSVNSTKADILKILTRLSSIYGPPRDRSYDLMAAEWHRALGRFRVVLLNRAIDHLTCNLKFFPTPAEIIDFCEREAEPPHRLPPYRADMEADFAATPEQLEIASKLCADWREKFGDAQAKVGADRFEHWQPASQDTDVSDDLRKSKVAQAAVSSHMKRMENAA